jgi:hypothetical protein
MIVFIANFTKFFIIFDLIGICYNLLPIIMIIYLEYKLKKPWILFLNDNIFNLEIKFIYFFILLF